MRKVLVVCGVLVSAAGSVFAFQEGFKVIRESLTGYQEVPVVSTTGHATGPQSSTRCRTPISKEPFSSRTSTSVSLV